MYARIDQGSVVAYPVDPRQENPHTSFPQSWAGGVLHGVEYALVSPSARPDVSHLFNVSEADPVLAGGVWVQGWSVTDASTEEVAQRTSDQWRSVRNERNYRLASCDWTQLADATVDAAAWAVYRQALRDLPQAQTDPFNIVWPTSP